MPHSKMNQPCVSQVKEIAAIDLGSNSFHMIIARVTNGSIQILSRLKQRVSLAAGLDEDLYLSQDAINRGVACLALFSKRLQGFPSENVKVVGTYTLRRAANNDEFLRQAAKVFPFPINIISGKQEASLIYSGASHTQPSSGRKFLIDIGGGSTEMIIGDAFKPLVVESRNLGCLSFATQFFADGKITEARYQQAYHAAMEELADLAPQYRELGWKTVWGSSGTIKTVMQLMAANYDKDGLISANNLRKLVKKALQFESHEQLNIAGLDMARSDVLLSGLAILSAVFNIFKIKSMRYSDGALREGVLYSMDKCFQVDDIRQRTIDGLSQQFSVDLIQAERVVNTASLLAAQHPHWQEEHKRREMCEVLQAAACLCEVGLVINHYGVERHSAYILLNNSMPGFDSEQQKLLATIVRFHKKSFQLTEIRSRTRYADADVLTLIILLRLAFIINRSRQATEFTDQFVLNVSEDSRRWRLTFADGYLARNPLTVHNLAEEKSTLRACGIKLETA